MPTRRTVLEVLAIGGAGLAGGCSATADPAQAWRAPGAGEADPRRWALAHAILAPNPHNRQPWLVELKGNDEIRLFVDLRRRLPETDPPDRQITIGCGAFLELLRLAAAQRGLGADIAIFPEGEPQPRLDARPVAHVRLSGAPGTRPDPLFHQIARRRTNRAPFDPKAPPSARELAAVTAAASGSGLQAATVAAGPLRRQLIEVCRQGYGVEMGNPATLMESVRLMRIGRAEIAASPDGVALSGPMIEAMRSVGMLSRKALADPGSAASKSGLDMWRKMIQATPAFLVIKSLDGSRGSQIAAGRAYARAQLTATALGLSMQPWSMTLQEFPAMADLYRRTQALLGASPDAPVQMLVRLGRAKPPAPAPRWPLASRIRA